MAERDLGSKEPGRVAIDVLEDIQANGENPLGDGDSSGAAGFSEDICENFTAWHEIAIVGEVVGDIGNVLSIVFRFDIVAICDSSGHELECLLGKIFELLVEVCAHVIGDLHIYLKKLVDLELGLKLEVEWKINWGGLILSGQDGPGVHELNGLLQQLDLEEVDEDLNLELVEVGNIQGQGLGDGSVSSQLVAEGPHFVVINLSRLVFSCVSKINTMVDLEGNDRLLLHNDFICKDSTVCEVSSWDQPRSLIRGSELLEFIVRAACIGVQVTSGYRSGYNSQGEQRAHYIINYY